MTTVIVVTSSPELAVAIATVDSGLLDRRDTCLLICSNAEASELDHGLWDIARQVADAEGLVVAHLNELIYPRHPLGWRFADLSAEEFARRWQSTGVAPITAVAQVGRKRNPAVGTLRKVTGAQRLDIAYSPEHLASALLTRTQHILLVDAPVGANVFTVPFRRRVRVVPRAALSAAKEAIRPFDALVDQAPWNTTLPRWWGRLLRSLLQAVIKLGTKSASTAPARPRKDPAERAQESIDFTRQLVAELDQRGHTSEPPTA